MSNLTSREPSNARAAKVRLSARQREVLELVEAACRPVELKYGEPERIIPLYIDHLPDLFFTNSERRRFIENLESRGLLRIDRGIFIYITEAGKSALTPPDSGTPARAKRRAT